MGALEKLAGQQQKEKFKRLESVANYLFWLLPLNNSIPPDVSSAPEVLDERGAYCDANFPGDSFPDGGALV